MKIETIRTPQEKPETQRIQDKLDKHKKQGRQLHSTHYEVIFDPNNRTYTHYILMFFTEKQQTDTDIYNHLTTEELEQQLPDKTTSELEEEIENLDL